MIDPFGVADLLAYARLTARLLRFTVLAFRNPRRAPIALVRMAAFRGDRPLRHAKKSRWERIQEMKVAFVGLGHMGLSMARNLIAAVLMTGVALGTFKASGNGPELGKAAPPLSLSKLLQAPADGMR